MTPTQNDDVLVGDKANNLIVGLAGDDLVQGQGGDDLLFGDFVPQNLLTGVEGATSFAQYAASGAWQVRQTADGHTEMSQSVETVAGAEYSIGFETAANYGSGTVSGAVEVLWNGQIIGRIDTTSGVFEDALFHFVGTGGTGEITFRSVDSEVEDTGPEVHTDAPIFYYEKVMHLGGEDVTVKAIAEGQNHIYQVLNGKLHAFDPDSETYTAAGAEATVVVNAIGFNQQDDMLYGIAVANGVDALERAVSKTDLVAYDASGACYRVGDTPYRSWTADFDDQGNLWAFHSSMDRVSMIDVDHLDEDGNPTTVTFKFPKSMVTDSVWDVAYDANCQSFYGLVRPSSAGQPAKLFQIDVSNVANGGEPEFSTTPVVSTFIDGAWVDGVPHMTFGAFVVDGDGNLYAGGNGGDHDMNGSTGTSGGIYRVVTDGATGELRLILVADAPKSYSNDGAIDSRAMDPFTEVDTYARVLIRAPELIEAPQGETSYDDTLEGGNGQDTADGGFGSDVVVGQSLGDHLMGANADDSLWGGAGPNAEGGARSVYDEAGTRYDAFGNILAEDDDRLDGGDGDDFLHGSAGHDTLLGGDGEDTLDGGSGFDNLSGGADDDVLKGGANTDTLSGGAGEDTLDGGSDRDLLSGDGGNDLLKGRSGADTLDGGSGADTLSGGSGHDDLSGGDGADQLKGGSGNDALSGGASDDALDGGRGNDSIAGDDGNDHIKGGSGNDLVDGGGGKDSINGGSGDDDITGGGGRDKIYLGAGSDVASGGADSDRFVFRDEDLDGSTDRITDFRHGSGEYDVLDFRALSLLDDGVTETDWLDNFVTETLSNDVVVDLGQYSLILTNVDQSATFRAEVCDGILL
ncbi:MAG: calcium-binding protein [Pseudomonadota bacterium]